MRNQPKYSREALILHLREMRRELGRVPTQDEVAKRRLRTGTGPSVEPFYREFGTFNQAISESGLEQRGRNGRPIRHTNQALVRHLQSLYRRTGRPPSTTVVNCEAEKNGTPHTVIYIARFGDWTNSLAAAGIPTDRTYRRVVYTDTELLSYLRDLGQVLGRPPVVKDIHKRRQDRIGPSYKTFVNHFGSWSNAIKLSGVRSMEFDDRTVSRWLQPQEDR